MSGDEMGRDEMGRDEMGRDEISHGNQSSIPTGHYKTVDVKVMVKTKCIFLINIYLMFGYLGILIR